MAKHHSKHHSKSDGHKHGAQHMHIHHHKKKGGRVGLVASGNPDVLEEAHEDKDGEETGHERKHGGRMHKKHKRQTGGKVIGLMTGGGVRPRLDRPGRKRGGAVGANTSPLSTAHSGGHGTDGSSSPTDTYGGTPS